MNQNTFMKLWSISFVLLIGISLLGCQEGDEPINPSPDDINLGNDTTLYVGDTLILDAGPGFDSYLWNDGLSTEQTLPVSVTGQYWVEVTKDNRMGTDTISVSFVDCDTTVAFFERSLTIPCSYSFTDYTGDDSRFIEIRSESQDIVIEYERGIHQPDTIFTLPESYKNYYPEKVSIVNKDNQDVGVVYFISTSGPFRNNGGFFLIKENTYYLELMRLSYAGDKADELIEILSTVQ